MRGTRGRHIQTSGPRRLIPTYAGNTLWVSSSQNTPAAHPHVCGEHNLLHSFHELPRGSSPRMRGTRDLGSPAHPRKRLIPTYAGNTSAQIDHRTSTAAHPHVCGEHVLLTIRLIQRAGSSPRMRGTRYVDINTITGDRLIPTYAGNTFGSSRHGCR